MTEGSRLETLRRRVESDPASSSFAALAEEYRRVGRLDEAIAAARAGLERYPRYVSARLTLGRALLEQGRAADACVELEVALVAAPDNLVARRALDDARSRLANPVGGACVVENVAPGEPPPPRAAEAPLWPPPLTASAEPDPAEPEAGSPEREPGAPPDDCVTVAVASADPAASDREVGVDSGSADWVEGTPTVIAPLSLSPVQGGDERRDGRPSMERPSDATATRQRTIAALERFHDAIVRERIRRTPSAIGA